MRAIDLCGVFLLAGSVVLALVRGLPVWPLTVSVSLEAPATSRAPSRAPSRDPSRDVRAPDRGSEPTHVRLVVLRSVPGLTGLALGDAVSFDRYGIYPAHAGATDCVPLQAGATRPLTLTALGGRLPDDPVARVDLVGAHAAAECVPRLPALLSLHP